MRNIFLSIVPALILLPLFSFAQRVIFSDVQKEDDLGMKFDILGRVDSNYLIYKNFKSRHVLTLYDRAMNVVSSERMKFMPDKTINSDFIMYPDYFYAIYQYEKSNVVYCYAVKLNNACQPISDPVLLDFTPISIIADNKIYSVIYSEDKRKVLLYKLHMKSGRLAIGTRLFDNRLTLLNSHDADFSFNEREDFLSDFLMANDGTLYFARNKRIARADNFNALELCFRNQGDSFYSAVDIPLEGRYIDEVFMKVDNLNRSLLMNSFYYSGNRGNILGIFTAARKVNGEVRYAFNAIGDSIRNSISSSGLSREVFDNLFIRNIYVRRNGGFVLVAERYSTRRQADDYAWSRSDYLNNFAGPAYNDFFFASPYSYYYPGFYRNYRPYTPTQSTRYYYDDVLTISMDSSLQMKWQALISKSQFDDDNENYLSFGNMNYGGELHFFFVEDTRKSDIVANQSILPDGQVRRYGAVKSREFSYSFMPRLARQTGPREMIMPCSRRGNITFALMDFNY